MAVRCDWATSCPADLRQVHFRADYKGLLKREFPTLPLPPPHLARALLHTLFGQLGWGEEMRGTPGGVSSPLLPEGSADAGG